MTSFWRCSLYDTPGQSGKCIPLQIPVNFPRNLYQTDYDSNAERIYDYVHSDRTDLLISGYYNPDGKKDIVRFVLKLHNYDEERISIGYLVCDINSAALTTIMKKYVDV